MGRELKIKEDQIKKLVEQANEMHEMVEIAMQNAKVGSSLNDAHGHKTDFRDITDLAYSFVVHGATPEERQADMNRQVKECVEAFKSGDPERKKPYLDMIFDLLEETPSFLDHEISEPEEFNRLISSCVLNQAYAVKRNEESEYVLNRYKTTEEKTKKGACSSLNATLFAMLSSFKNKKAPDLIIKSAMDIEMMQMVGFDYIINFNLGMGEAALKGSNEMIFDIPMSCLNDVNADYDKDKHMPITFEQMLAEFDTQLTFARFVGEDTDNRSIGDNCYDFVYLGDKSFADLAKEELLKKPEFHGSKFKLEQNQINCQAEILFRKALLDGNNVISLAIPQWDGEKIDNAIIKIKPNIAKLKEDLIKEGQEEVANTLPSQEDVNKVYENSDRFDKSINDMTNAFLENTKNDYYTKTNLVKDELTFKNDDIVQEGIDKFEEMHELVNNAFKKHPEKPQGHGYDHRDLINIAMLFDVKGETLEEKQQDMDKQFDDMEKAFDSGDINQKIKYLDLLYESYDKSLLGVKRDVQTADEVKLLIVSSQLGQTIHTKAIENYDYYHNRFDDGAANQKSTAIQLIHEELDSQIRDMYESHLHKTKLNFWSAPKGMEDQFDLRRKFAKAFCNTTSINRTEVKLEIPQNYANLDKKELHSQVEQLMSSFSGIGNDIDVVRKRANTKNINDKDIMAKMFFIDNDSVEDLARAAVRKERKFRDRNKPVTRDEINEKAAELISNVMLKGDKVLSGVNVTKNERGMFYQSFKIKPELSAIREQEMEKHSWFRKTFFNWGIFTIHPKDQKDIDKMYKDFDSVNVAQLAEDKIDDYAAKFNVIPDRQNVEKAKTNEINIDKKDVSKETEQLREFLKMEEEVSKKASSLNSSKQYKAAEKEIKNMDDDIMIPLNKD